MKKQYKGLRDGDCIHGLGRYNCTVCYHPQGTCSYGHCQRKATMKVTSPKFGTRVACTRCAKLWAQLDGGTIEAIGASNRPTAMQQGLSFQYANEREIIVKDDAIRCFRVTERDGRYVRCTCDQFAGNAASGQVTCRHIRFLQSGQEKAA